MAKQEREAARKRREQERSQTILRINPRVREVLDDLAQARKVWSIFSSPVKSSESGEWSLVLARSPEQKLTVRLQATDDELHIGAAGCDLSDELVSRLQQVLQEKTGLKVSKYTRSQWLADEEDRRKREEEDRHMPVY